MIAKKIPSMLGGGNAVRWFGGGEGVGLFSGRLGTND